MICKAYETSFCVPFENCLVCIRTDVVIHSRDAMINHGMVTQQYIHVLLSHGSIFDVLVMLVNNVIWILQEIYKKFHLVSRHTLHNFPGVTK
jgi:hypothetical protein